MFLAVFISWLIFGKRNGISCFSTAFSNAGFIGIPLVQAVLGSDAVFYISIMILIAPQIGYDRRKIEELAAPYEDIKILDINPDAFASGKADAILDQIRLAVNGAAGCATLKNDERGIEMSETAGKKTFMYGWRNRWILRPEFALMENQEILYIAQIKSSEYE